MSDWSFDVPPDITVTLRASKRPALLARCLGSEVAPHAVPTLFLELGAKDVTGDIAQGRYRGVPWRCGVTARPDGRLALSWRSPLLREYLALHIALLPALRRLLLQRDIALITGAAFASGGKATVLAGETGSGKTALLLAALGSGARLSGDEYIGVSAAGVVTPVLRVIALRSAALAAAPQLARRLSARRGLALRAAATAALVTARRLDPLVHVAPDELGLEGGTNGGALSRIVWLERGNGSGRRSEPARAEDVIEALARAAARHDDVYGVSDALRSDESGASRWRDVLARGLAGARCERLTLPKGTLTPDVLRDLLGETQGALS